MHVCRYPCPSVTYRVEDARTLIMIERWIDIVRANSVDAHILHERRIAQTNRRITQWIPRASAIRTLSSWLVVHTNDHEALVGLRVDEFLLLNDDWIDGEGGGCEGA